MKTMKSNRMSAVCGLITGLAALVTHGATPVFYWTGEAGDGKWSTPGNWAADAEGTPVETGPSTATAAEYHFENYASGTVVDADFPVNCSGKILEVVPAGTASAALTFTGSFKALPKTIHLSGKSELTLRVDASADADVSLIQVSDPGDTSLNTLVLDFTQPNARPRNFAVWHGTVRVANAASAKHLCLATMGLASRIEFAADAKAATIFRTDEGAARFLGQVDLGDHTVTLGEAITSSATNNFDSVLRTSAGGALKLAGERNIRMRCLGAGSPTVELDSGDLTVDRPSVALHWTFDDPANPLADDLGLGDTFLAVGTPTVVSDPVRGNVLSCDGTSGLQAPGQDMSFCALPCGVSNAYTFAMWFKPDSACDTKAKLAFWGSNVNGRAMALRLDTTAGKKLLFAPWGDNQNVTTAADPRDGNWHHVAVVYAGGNTFRVYYDGVEALNWNLVEKCRPYQPPNQNFQVGYVKSAAWSGNYYKGRLDDVTLLTYPLTAEQVADLYENGLTDTARPNLVAAAGGSLFTDCDEFKLGTISGRGVAGGLETAGSRITVGADDAAATEFAAQIRGNAAKATTLVKDGAGYDLTFSGETRGVSNVVVKAGTLTLRQPLARRGLVCYYSFEDASVLGRDASPAALLLDVLDGSGGATISSIPGVAGKGAHFALGARLNSNNRFRPKAFPMGNDSHTVSVWVRPTKSCCEGKGAICFWGSTATCKEVMVRFDSRTALTLTNFGNALTASGLPPLDDGAWHHVAATYDAAAKTQALYLDGVCVASKGNVPTLDVLFHNSFMIGRSQNGAAGDYEGDMDEFQLFNYAWTAEEAQAEFRRQPAATVDPDTLLPVPFAHWTFDDADDLGKDSGPNALNLVQGGTTPVVAATDGFSAGAAQFAAYRALKMEDAGRAKLPTGNVEYSVLCRYKPNESQGNVLGNVMHWGADVSTENSQAGKMVKVGCEYNVTNSYRCVAAGKTVTFSPKRSHISIGTDRQRWINAGLIYRPLENSVTATNLVKFYVDGEHYANYTGMKSQLVGDNFILGAQWQNGGMNAYYKGLVDDLRIYDCALSAGEIAAVTRTLNARGEGYEPYRCLQGSPAVTVEAGATLAVQSCEAVSSLSGAGTVSLAPLARLSVADRSGFAGTFVGNGALVVPDGDSFAVASAAALPCLDVGSALELGRNVTVTLPSDLPFGTSALFRAAGGIAPTGADLESVLATWRIEGDCAGTAKLKLSADGRTLCLKVSGGFTLLVK